MKVDTRNSMPESLDFEKLDDIEARKDLAKMLIKLFKHWNLNTEQQLSLLGLSTSSRKVLSEYAEGAKGITKNRDTFDRVGYLLAIHKALRLLYPENPSTRYKWVTLKNKAFDNFTPVEIMIDEGIIGLARIARYLDFIRGH